MKIIKNILLLSGSGFILISAIININNQLSSLIDAYKINKELTKKIVDLEKENRILEQKIAYSTSSAYLNQQARELFGVGTPNDVWLEIPKEEKKEEPRTAVETGKVPIWKKIWNLIVRP